MFISIAHFMVTTACIECIEEQLPSLSKETNMLCPSFSIQEYYDEACLAVLNNKYQDGIKWHDVACYIRSISAVHNKLHNG